MKYLFFEKILIKVKDGLNIKNNACLDHVIQIIRMVLNYKDSESNIYFYFSSKMIFILPNLIKEPSVQEFLLDILTNKYEWISRDEFTSFFKDLEKAGFFDTFTEML